MVKQINKKNTFFEQKKNYNYNTKKQEDIKNEDENNVTKKNNTVKLTINKNSKKNTANHE